MTRPPGYVIEVGPERARRLSVRGARRSGGGRRAGGSSDDAQRGPRSLARDRPRRRRVRGVRAAGDRAPRRDAPGRSGAPARSRPRARPSRRGDRRAGGARRPARTAGAPVRPAHARALPVRTPGGGARLLPGDARTARRRARDRAGAGAAPARACRFSARTRRSISQGPRRRNGRFWPSPSSSTGSTPCSRSLSRSRSGRHAN